MSFLGAVRAGRGGRYRQYLEEACSRCEGKGEIQQYKHHDSGLCYWCDGVGKEPKGKKSRSLDIENTPRVPTEHEKKVALEEIRASLRDLRERLPHFRGEPRSELEFRMKSLLDLVLDRYRMLKNDFGDEFGDRVLARIRVNLTPADAQKFERILADPSYKTFDYDNY